MPLSLVSGGWLTLLLLLLRMVTAEHRCTKHGQNVECIFKNSTVFKMPPSFQNMTIEIFGGSGGASLGADNKPDHRTRGIGLYIRMAVEDHVEPGSLFMLIVPMNGKDATETASGYQPPRPIGDQPGSGGQLIACQHKRFAGSGATGSAVMSLDYYAHFGPGGPGGGGAYDSRQSIIPHGGHTAFLNASALNGRGVTFGESGYPAGISGGGGQHIQIGWGGRADPNIKSSRNGRPGQHQYHAGGDGGNGVDALYCLAGGGGGSGWRGSGGGASFTSDDLDTAGFAGSGGSGSSQFHQDRPTYRLLHQERMYSAVPRLVIKYSIPLPPEAMAIPQLEEESRKCSIGCNIM